MTFASYLKRLKEHDYMRHPDWNAPLTVSELKIILALLEAADRCADVLDANYQTIADNSDEDDLAIVNDRLNAWREVVKKWL